MTGFILFGVNKMFPGQIHLAGKFSDDGKAYRCTRMPSITTVAAELAPLTELSSQS